MRFAAAAGALVLGILVAACSAIDPTGTMETDDPATIIPAPSLESNLPDPPGAGATPCPIPREAGEIPFDRLVGVEVGSVDGADVVAFVFERSSTPPPPGTASGSLALAAPPFLYGASGLPIELHGERVIAVRFDGQTIASEDGDPVYEGPLDLRPDLPAVRDVVNFDLSEGVIGWYIAWDGPGCIDLATGVDQVAVIVAHPG